MERSAFELHTKERPNASGKQPLRCLALGDSPTVTCPLRELSLSDLARPVESHQPSGIVIVVGGIRSDRMGLPIASCNVPFGSSIM